MEAFKKILRTPSAFVLLLVAVVSLIGVIIKSETDKAIARIPIDATSTAEARLTESANLSQMTQSTIVPSAIWTQLPTDTQTPISTFSAKELKPSTPVVIPERDPNTGHLILYASCNCKIKVESNEEIIVRLRWGAQTAELAEQGSNLISFSLIIDNQEILNLDIYKQKAVFEQEPKLPGDLGETWWVYWDYPVKFTGYSETHLVQTEIETLSEINNGWSVIPANYVKRSEIQIETFYVAKLKQCNDNIDNDGDGTVDLQDAQCINAGDDDEGN